MAGSASTMQSVIGSKRLVSCESAAMRYPRVSGARFCPDNAMNRASGAILLVRAFDFFHDQP